MSNKYRAPGLAAGRDASFSSDDGETNRNRRRMRSPDSRDRYQDRNKRSSNGGGFRDRDRSSREQHGSRSPPSRRYQDRDRGRDTRDYR